MEKVGILEFDEIIIRKEGNGFNVFVGDRSSGQLGYDECLGLVSTLVVQNSHKGCLSWLRTKEQNEAIEERWSKELEIKLLKQNN